MPDEADHNARPILADFRRERGRIVARLESLSEEQVVKSAIYPRLRQPMRTLTLFFFVAEHDDHHLACITEIVRAS